MSLFLEDVLDNIESQHCVVLLGPNVPRDKSGRLIQDTLFRYAQENFAVSRDGDGLLHFESGRDQTRYPNLYRRFILKEAVLSPLHRMLVELPVHLYVSLTPDLLLSRAFEEKSFVYHSTSYHKGRPQEVVDLVPSSEQPMVYNLFGQINEPDSLVYTQDDLFDFLFSILGPENPIPDKVLHSISSARLFLFLGFEFDRWYLKLLLRLFNLHQKRIVLSAGVHLTSADVQAFYKDQFEMVFVSEKIDTYVEALHRGWSQRKPYRQSEQGEQGLADRIRECMRKDQLEDGLDLLGQFLEARNSPERSTMVMLSGEYYGTMRKLDRNTIAESDANRTFARIREGVINLVNEEAPS